MMEIAKIIQVAKWLTKTNRDQMSAVDFAKGHENNAVRALKICQKRRMGTSTVLFVMEYGKGSRN